MAFTAGQVLTAAQLNDFSTNSLGVGTTSPETPITIVTTNKLGSTFTGTTDGEGLRVDQSNYTANNYVSLVEASYQDDQTAPHVRMAAQFTGGGSKLAFGTTNSYGSGITNQALTIDAAGQIGIGTTSPGEPLHIVTASGDAFLKQENGTATTFSGPDSSNTGLYGTSSNHDTRFITNNTERVRITSSGAVGIGTSSPGGNFQVESQGRAFTVIDSGVTNHAEAAFTTLGGDSPAFSIISAYDMDFQTGTSRGGLTSRMTIASGGDINMDSGTLFVDASTNEVGIGDTVPDAKLHVNSGGTNTTAIFESTDANAYIGIKDNSSSGNIYVGIGAVGNELRLRAGNSNHIHLEAAGTLENASNNFYASNSGSTFVAAAPPTGTGNDAEWSAPFGIYVLYRNSSLAAEKENISADLGEHLTADMIDSVVPKMWNRIHAPGYPEIGPIAEDMDAISPFLAARGTTAENVPFLTGINKTAYLSLLVLAVKDLRARVAALEA